MTRITDAAVEAGAEQMYEESQATLRWPAPWSEVNDQDYYRRIFRAGAAAALPHLEGATPDWTDEERGFVETALAAADAGDAGHWPTVATYLAAEVRRLRACEGATPAIDREALQRLAEKWADMDTPGLTVPANREWAAGVDQGYSNAAAELLALIGGAS